MLGRYEYSHGRGLFMKIGPKLKRFFLIIILIVLFIQTPMFQLVKSYSVMFFYSKIHEDKSFLSDENIEINIPGGWTTAKMDYYPFVMTFDPSESFSRRVGTDVDLTVLYNFGAMKWSTGASIMYDVNSPYYSGFYGAYTVRYNEIDRQYGLNEDGSINIEEVMDITDYDLKILVMKSVGNKDPHVEYTITNLDNPSIITIDGLEFTVFDADLEMDGLYHIYEKDYRAYIQYGRPALIDGVVKSFEMEDMYGRIYCHFDKETKISYFLYIIASTKGTILETETSYIKETEFEGIR